MSISQMNAGKKLANLASAVQKQLDSTNLGLTSKEGARVSHMAVSRLSLLQLDLLKMLVTNPLVKIGTTTHSPALVKLPTSLPLAAVDETPGSLLVMDRAVEEQLKYILRTIGFTIPTMIDVKKVLSNNGGQDDAARALAKSIMPKGKPFDVAREIIATCADAVADTSSLKDTTLEALMKKLRSVDNPFNTLSETEKTVLLQSLPREYSSVLQGMIVGAPRLIELGLFVERRNNGESGQAMPLVNALRTTPIGNILLTLFLSTCVKGCLGAEKPVSLMSLLSGDLMRSGVPVFEMVPYAPFDNIGQAIGGADFNNYSDLDAYWICIGLAAAISFLIYMSEDQTPLNQIQDSAGVTGVSRDLTTYRLLAGRFSQALQYDCRLTGGFLSGLLLSMADSGLSEPYYDIMDNGPWPTEQAKAITDPLRALTPTLIGMVRFPIPNAQTRVLSKLPGIQQSSDYAQSPIKSAVDLGLLIRSTQWAVVSRRAFGQQVDTQRRTFGKVELQPLSMPSFIVNRDEMHDLSDTPFAALLCGAVVSPYFTSAVGSEVPIVFGSESVAMTMTGGRNMTALAVDMYLHQSYKVARTSPVDKRTLPTFTVSTDDLLDVMLQPLSGAEVYGDGSLVVKCGLGKDWETYAYNVAPILGELNFMYARSFVPEGAGRRLLRVASGLKDTRKFVNFPRSYDPADLQGVVVCREVGQPSQDELARSKDATEEYAAGLRVSRSFLDDVKNRPFARRIGVAAYRNGDDILPYRDVYEWKDLNGQTDCLISLKALCSSKCYVSDYVYDGFTVSSFTTRVLSVTEFPLVGVVPDRILGDRNDE